MKFAALSVAITVAPAALSTRINKDVQRNATVSWKAFEDWDPDLLKRPCLGQWMQDSGTSLEAVCSDKADNNIKDDKGNYIQFTRREDALMYKVWDGALQDCAKGESYVRDIVASFSERTSCFKDETTLIDEDRMHIENKLMKRGKISVAEGADEKFLCPGDKKTKTQTKLNERLALLGSLVSQWDGASNGPHRLKVCKEMLAAHTLKDYWFIGVLKSTRPAACNATSAHHDEALCKAAEDYLVEFRNRDLFASAENGGFKGRAAKGENERSEKCAQDILKGKPWFTHLTTNVGSTVEQPKCTIDTTREEVFRAPVLKVGLYSKDMANNMIADAYRQCGAVFVAGISATMPQYIASAAGGPTKKGKPFAEALSDKEILTLMAMLELGGFHAITGLSLSVNYYKKKLFVTPPFDSGDFVASANGGSIIRCHDSKTNCCTNSTKHDGFYNHQVYTDMILKWESIVQSNWAEQPLGTVQVAVRKQ